MTWRLKIWFSLNISLRCKENSWMILFVSISFKVLMFSVNLIFNERIEGKQYSSKPQDFLQQMFCFLYEINEFIAYNSWTVVNWILPNIDIKSLLDSLEIPAKIWRCNFKFWGKIFFKCCTPSSGLPWIKGEGLKLKCSYVLLIL